MDENLPSFARTKDTEATRRKHTFILKKDHVRSTWVFL